MPKYIIERNLPRAVQLAPAELAALSEKACTVLRGLGPGVQWVQSYVTGDRIYCVYIAPNESLIREHARLGGLPADSIAEIKSIIDPTTSEAAAPQPERQPEHDLAKEAGVY